MTLVHRTFAILFLAGFAPLALPAGTKAEVWPGADWEVEARKKPRNPEALKELEAYVFPPTPEPDAPVTNALLLVKGGRIIYERYANGYRADMRHPAWSISKSVLNAVLGAAIMDGKITLSDPVCKYLPAPDPKQCAITVEHLARQSSGLDWSEDYEDSDEPKDSDVLALLYGEGIENMEDFILKLHAPRFPPGTRWNYSSGDSNLLSILVNRALPAEERAAYPWRRLFGKIGAKSFLWERDARNIFVASSYLHATARDLARFGLLFLREGRWKSETLLTKAWIKYSRELAPAMTKTRPRPNPRNPEPEAYGAHWWLNLPNPAFGIAQPWPNNPPDVYAALGHWGQGLLLVPGDDLIVVRFGNDRRKRIAMDQLLTLARAYAK